MSNRTSRRHFVIATLASTVSAVASKSFAGASNKIHARGGVHLEHRMRILGSTMSQSSVRAVVTHALPALEQCYAAGLAQNASLRGHVHLTISVSPQGRVVGASATGDRPTLATVAQCFAQASHAWGFAAQSSGASSQIELHFRLGEDRRPQYNGPRMGSC